MLEAARSAPSLKVVLNRMGDPPVSDDGWDPLGGQIVQATNLPNMSVKLCDGLALAVRWSWSTASLRRYPDHVIDRFTPHGVMTGSNWPAILLCARVAETWRGFDRRGCPELGGRRSRAKRPSASTPSVPILKFA